MTDRDPSAYRPLSKAERDFLFPRRPMTLDDIARERKDRADAKDPSPRLSWWRHILARLRG